MVHLIVFFPLETCRGKMPETANKNLEKVIALCSEMLELADLGDHYRPDDGCGVVFGMMRDSAYKIRGLAKDELARHECRRKPIT